MASTALHEKKKKKNLAVLGAIIIFMAIIFCVTIIRLKAGVNAAPAETAVTAEQPAETQAEGQSTGAAPQAE